MKSRNLAYKVLFDIEKNQNYSNMAINKHFKDCNLDNRDRGFATEIIYGVVENKIYLDYIIDKLSKIKSNKLNLKVKILLRMGIYQILFLDSVSDYAAVNETVNLTKKLDNRSAGFVNAVLRNVIRQKEDIGEVKIKDTVDNLATKYSYNKWIVRNWISNFGREFTEDLLEANTERPSIYLRVNTLKTTRDELIKLLKEQVGKPYVWGANGPDSFDCSGLVRYVYKNALGKDIPRVSEDQSKVGQAVSRENLQPGDLVFFDTMDKGKVSHVGMYIGNNEFIHAANSKKGVIKSTLTGYYDKKFINARRP